jgi:hypothetical protein
MKKLKFFDELYSAERIVKTADSITGFNGDKEVFSLSGISDLSGFDLMDGADWDEPETNVTNTLGTLLLESAKDKATIANLEDTLGTVMLELANLKGGMLNVVYDS